MLKIHRLSSALIIAALLSACEDQLTQPPSPIDPSFAILDGAHGGNARFFFLSPMVPAPTYSGTFDASQTPVVNICELAGSTCGATVASFTGAQVKVDLVAESYGANWKTKGAGLNPAKTYRIQVLVGTNVLGYADVVVLQNGSQIKTVDKNQYVAVINGGVLQIRFRIEGGTPPPSGVWQNGDLVTYDHEDWGTIGTAAANLLMNNFFTVFTSGYVEIGIAGAAGFSAAFTSAQAVFDYLPTTGVSGALDNDVVDPTSTSAGYFGSFVLALQLSVDFTDSGGIAGTSGLKFGDLRLCALTTTPAYNNLTVRQFLAEMNTALGGGPAAYSFDDMANLAYDVSLAFEAGVPSSFAQAHLVNGACPGGWQNGDLVTYSQDSWGDPAPSAAATLLLNRFNFRYPGGMEVGLPGTPGFSMTFTSATAIVDFLPGSGTVGPLNNDLADPTSSASGAYGGYVLALQLSVDFADSGDIAGTSGLKFGDLRLCGLQTTPAYNGMTVRQFLVAMNTALGAGPTGYNYDEIAHLTDNVSLAFEAGVPSAFAQIHLVNGACP